MGVKGLDFDRKNPRFTVSDFLVWMPHWRKYVETAEGAKSFTMMRRICNEKILYSVLGIDWHLGMSYGIAHYFELIKQQASNPGGSNLGSVGGGAVKGILSSASVGGFSQSFDHSKSMSEDKESMFWNQTDYGRQLMLLYNTKPIPSLFVITDDRKK